MSFTNVQSAHPTLLQSPIGLDKECLNLSENTKKVIVRFPENRHDIRDVRFLDETEQELVLPINRLVRESRLRNRRFSIRGPDGAILCSIIRHVSGSRLTATFDNVADSGECVVRMPFLHSNSAADAG